jgi:hypothetical protein
MVWILDCFELFCCLWRLFYYWWILVELLVLRVFILLFMPYFLFMNKIGMSVVLRYWSLVDISKGCCWCDPSSTGTLTRIDLLEYVCWARFATDYTYAIYIGNLFLLVMTYRTACYYVIISTYCLWKWVLRIFNSMKSYDQKKHPKSSINST